MRGVMLAEVLTPWAGMERCGVWFEELMFEFPNMAGKPIDSFKMEAEGVFQLSEQVGEPIVGIWHSHPDGKPEPSKTDYDFHPVGYSLAIVENGVWRVWDPVEKVLLGESRLR